jgi:uncharacterized protein YndB with AHSA1/START domain
MTITDKTDRTQTDALTFELELRHAPEKVWRALTDPVLLSEWLLPAFNLKLEAGANFTLQTQAFPGWDGKVNCQFVEIEAARKLSYTWRAMEIDTVVTFTLTPTASGTHLTLVQAGFKADQKQDFGGARYGWNMMGTKLLELLERIA